MHVAGSDSDVSVGREDGPTLKWRRATAEDVIAYYGEPYRQSMRANAIVLDGEVAGLVGVVRHKEWGVFFSDHKPQLRDHLSSVTVWRAIKDAMAIVESYRGPVMSIADDAESCIQLTRLGFQHLYGAWWGWLGQRQ